MLIITGIAASTLGLLYIRLSFNVIGYRRSLGVSVGDGGHEDLLRAIRAQANLAEYAPIALILIGCLELNQAPIWLVSILAAVFVIGRLMHPMGMKSADSPLQPRVRGMILTFLSLGAISLVNLVFIVMHLFAN